MKIKNFNFRNVAFIVLCVALATGTACTFLNQPKTASTENSVSTSTNSVSTSTNQSNSSPSANPTQAKDAADIAGSYTVTGTNPNGAGKYNGDLTITKRDEVYQFSWTSGNNNYDGVGVRTDNTIAVSFTDGTDGKGCGVVFYKILSDGTLDGKAGYWGVNQSETEKAVRTSGSDLAGAYDVSGTNTGGKTYTGKLTVHPAGAGYTFAWAAPDPLEGFGIKQNNTVSVGIGGSQCSFVAYEIKPDGTLDGKWGGASSTDFGTETARKK